MLHVRCANDLFSYCSAPENKHIEDEEIIEKSLSGRINKVTVSVTRCDWTPGLCPHRFASTEVIQSSKG